MSRILKIFSMQEFKKKNYLEELFSNSLVSLQLKLILWKSVVFYSKCLLVFVVLPTWYSLLTSFITFLNLASADGKLYNCLSLASADGKLSNCCYNWIYWLTQHAAMTKSHIHKSWICHKEINFHIVLCLILKL